MCGGGGGSRRVRTGCVCGGGRGGGVGRIIKGVIDKRNKR